MSLSNTAKSLALGDLFLQSDLQSICNKRGEAVQLRRREYQLLNFFANNLQIVINRYAILDLIWDYGSFAGSNTLEVHLCSLRRKLKRLSHMVEIQTIRGVGYRLITKEKLLE